MESALDKLLSIASPALSFNLPHLVLDSLALADSRVEELMTLLGRRNGFYAFESALHVFPAISSDKELGLERWNSSSLWRSAYGDMTAGCFFFAEDVFGGQFCIRQGAIHTFEPETGKLEFLGSSLEEWARSLLKDYEVLTGCPLAHKWQQEHGPLTSGIRLVPRIPFICGGQFTLENLVALDAVRGMRVRGQLATKLKDLPDGTRIEFQIVD